MRITTSNDELVHIAAIQMGLSNPRKTACLMDEADSDAPFKRTAEQPTCPFCKRDAR